MTGRVRGRVGCELRSEGEGKGGSSEGEEETGRRDSKSSHLRHHFFGHLSTAKDKMMMTVFLSTSCHPSRKKGKIAKANIRIIFLNGDFVVTREVNIE